MQRLLELHSPCLSRGFLINNLEILFPISLLSTHGNTCAFATVCCFTKPSSPIHALTRGGLFHFKASNKCNPFFPGMPYSGPYLIFAKANSKAAIASSAES